MSRRATVNDTIAIRAGKLEPVKSKVLDSDFAKAFAGDAAETASSDLSFKVEDQVGGNGTIRLKGRRSVA
jgi:hypothetical protein